MFKALRNKFDACFVLNLSNRVDRRRLMSRQFDALGFETSGSWLRLFYATRFPFNDIIIDAFNKSGKGEFTKPEEYDCARNHYSIVKTAFDYGYSSVLVMEDDILFLNNQDILREYVNQIPSDFDIVQFGGFTTHKKVKEILEKKHGLYWAKHKNIGLWCTSMYALSRKGMEYYIKSQEKHFWVADGPFYKAPSREKLNTYMPTVPLVIQADKQRIKSDIRNSMTDNTDYNNDNTYEYNIKPEDYFKI